MSYLYARQFGFLGFEPLEAVGLVERDADIVRREDREFVRRDASGFEVVPAYELAVLAANDIGVSFYESHGFERFETEKAEIGRAHV